MQRIVKHLRIGWRWSVNGWRLFTFNPWLLGGMGLTAAALIGALIQIPLIGGLLIALLAPIGLASTCLAVDAVRRQAIPLPAALRLSALKQSPRFLIAVFRHEGHVLSTIAACLYSVAAVLLTNLPVRLLAGNAWVAEWSSLEPASQAGVLVVMTLVFVLYLVLAASLIYALPLALLRDEPLIPSLRQSLRASRHFAVALLVLLGLLLAPLLLGAMVAPFSRTAGWMVSLLAGAMVLPLTVASLYCSYRDIFLAREQRAEIETRAASLPTGRRIANASR